MKSLKPVVCASLLTVAISTSAMAGNIGGMRTTSAGNIGGLRTNRVGNIGGVRAGTLPTTVSPAPTAPEVSPNRFEISLIENLGGFLSVLISLF
jgi:hypothetical protein